MIMGVVLTIVILIVAIFLLSGIKIVRPTSRGLIETLGKYSKFAMPGFHWIFPGVQKIYRVNITEQMVDATPQVIITNDNLNATVDAQVYFKVESDEESVKNSIYYVNNYQYQIVNLARTTLRNIIGTMTLKSANSERGKSIPSCMKRCGKKRINGVLTLCGPSLRKLSRRWMCRKP